MHTSSSSSSSINYRPTPSRFVANLPHPMLRSRSNTNTTHPHPSRASTTSLSLTLLPPSAASTQTQNTQPAYKQPALAYYIIKSKYRISWECAELGSGSAGAERAGPSSNLGAGEAITLDGGDNSKPPTLVLPRQVSMSVSVLNKGRSAVALLLSHRAISPNGIHPPRTGTTPSHLAALLRRVDIQREEKSSKLSKISLLPQHILPLPPAVLRPPPAQRPPPPVDMTLIDQPPTPASQPPVLKGYLNKYTNVVKGYNTWVRAQVRHLLILPEPARRDRRLTRVHRVDEDRRAQAFHDRPVPVPSARRREPEVVHEGEPPRRGCAVDGRAGKECRVVVREGEGDASEGGAGEGKGAGGVRRAIRVG
ncbi:hypothetical protein LshimejAT787_2200770 [Lyophyllum shimeji]|uniref:Uncharacterized protein n=1 Tax=Lyophyllum shimeji TaxID=47721 RepID=A0A9P3URR8_LYOSH|nr:hypothetical protein LshimejAT787_2200770 [Lyophyllum shimeji]